MALSNNGLQLFKWARAEWNLDKDDLSETGVRKAIGLHTEQFTDAFNRHFKGDAEIRIDGRDALTITVGRKTMTIRASQVTSWGTTPGCRAS